MVSIRFVDKFPEPAFQELQREVFAPLEVPSTEFTTAVQAEVPAGSSPDHALWPPMFRFGAFSDEQLVGWTYGWFQRPDCFVMANSGVLSTHRRLGVYSRLVETIVEYAQSRGAATLHSRHSVLNTPVIIAKLKLGLLPTLTKRRNVDRWSTSAGRVAHADPLGLIRFGGRFSYAG